MITKDLGAVSAYAYAVEKGYTGTEAEYAELMASYASVAQQASQSAQTASEKAQQASASATSASQSASTASASATSVQASAQTASAKASEAQQSATTATTKAQEASQSASESSQSASTAVQAKQDAQTAKTASETAQGIAESARDDAESARDTASQSAQTATEKAQQASASATSASQSASTASASATSAQASAQTATAKASEAQQGAQTAAEKAQEASQSASESAQSAQTAVQAKEDAQTAKTASETAQASAESARDDAETARDEAQQYAESIDPQKLIGAYPVDTATGAIASFSDGADNIPMKDVLIHIEPVQEGSGDPSPDNVRPITGWTGAKVTRCGKNLLNPTLASGTYTINEITWTLNNDGSVTVSGTATANSYLWIYGSSSNPIPSWMHKLAGKTVTVSTGNGHFTQSGYASIQVIFYGSPTLVIREETATIPLDLSPYTGFAIVLFANTGNTVDATVYPQLELGSTATAYEPYSGQTYDITFPSEAGTVYGGELDVTNGVLTVDRAIITKNTADMNNTATDYPGWRNSGIEDIIGLGFNGLIPNLIMNVGTVCGAKSDGGVMMLPKSVYGKTQDEWKALSIDVQVVLPLATPITLTLSPTEIKSLLGDNNLWADTGDSTVTYRADTTLYINRKIAEAVSALS